MITSDAKCYVEAKRRITMGNEALYNKKKELLIGKLNIDL